MANRLKMAVIETIHTLRRRGWSARRIARELGVDRETVGRHLRAPPADPNAAIAPLGSASEAPGSTAAIAPLGSGAEPGGPDPVEPSSEPAVSPAPPRIGRPSACAPFRAVIVAAWERDLSARRIFQDLVAEHGFAGSYYSVRRFVRQLGRRADLPVRRMECGPGDECQVDFGRGAPVVGPDGKRQSTHVLRVVLSHSRKGYSEVVFRQTTEAFVRCLENAFRHFGGVPRRVVLDNLRAAVTRADWFDPELNPKVEAFGRHYGTAFWPTKPYTPRHKGKVERGVGYVKNNALKGRTFASVAAQNAFLQEWERTVADTRIHGTIRRQVGPYFVAVEKPALLPLPPGLFPSFEEGRRVVNRDGHVEVGKAFYSVPPEYLGRRVWVRWDGRVVRVFNDRQEQVALHPRHEPGRFSTLTPHVASEKVSGVERGAAWILGRVRRVGPHCAAWAEACLSARGVEGVRALQGLLSLAAGRFVREARDVRLIGPPGVGKSFLAQAIGYAAVKAGMAVTYRSIFDLVRDFLHDEALGGEDKVLGRYLKPDLLIIDDMGMKQLPKRSGEYLFEIIMRRYETRSTLMTSNRPLDDWGKLIGDVPSATAILDRFLHHAEVIRITGRSYRLRNQSQNPGEKENRPPAADGLLVPDGQSNAAKAPPGSPDAEPGSNAAKAPSGSKPAKATRTRSPPAAKA